MSKSNATMLMEESDRGCVLVAAAILENCLEELFRNIFTRNKVSKKLQDSIFDFNNPLSTFSSKIKLAYSLGHISRQLFEDLETIRKIRNKFAHTSIEVDFIGDEVSEKIELMHCIQDDKETLTRYSLSPEHSLEEKPSEADMRSAGYVKATKGLLAIGVYNLKDQLQQISAEYL